MVATAGGKYVFVWTQLQCGNLPIMAADSFLYLALPRVPNQNLAIIPGREKRLSVFRQRDSVHIVGMATESAHRQRGFLDIKPMNQVIAPARDDFRSIA